MSALKLHGVGVAIAVCTLLSACAAELVDPFDISGSKAGGTVVMGATVGLFQKVDWSGAATTATQRCAAWGYSGSQAFSGIRVRCIDSDCLEKEVTRVYQCLE